jgi:hypothetical protein
MSNFCSSIQEKGGKEAEMRMGNNREMGGEKIVFDKIEKKLILNQSLRLAFLIFCSLVVCVHIYVLSISPVYTLAGFDLTTHSSSLLGGRPLYHAGALSVLSFCSLFIDF